MPQQQGEEEDPLAGFGSSLFDAEFDPSEHPQDDDNGRFVEKGEGSGGSGDYDDSEKEYEPQPSTTYSEGINVIVKRDGEITLDEESRTRYNKAIVSLVTSEEDEITELIDHCYDRIAERNVSIKDIITALQSPEYTHPSDVEGRLVYGAGHTRVVFEIETGAIITVMTNQEVRTWSSQT